MKENNQIFYKEREVSVMIAARLTFLGACRDAADFYCQVFHGDLILKTLFQDHSDQFPMGLSGDAGNFIYSAIVRITDENGRSYISMGDSPVIAFSGRQGDGRCRDNVVFDVNVSSPSEVERIYDAFIHDGARCNIALCTRKGYRKYASFIDRFGICWNVFCPEPDHAEPDSGDMI